VERPLSRGAYSLTLTTPTSSRHAFTPLPYASSRASAPCGACPALPLLIGGLQGLKEELEAATAAASKLQTRIAGIASFVQYLVRMVGRRLSELAHV